MLKADFDRHFKILEGALRGSRWNDGPLTAEVRKSRHEAFWQAFRNVWANDWERVIAEAIEQFNEFPHIPDLKGMIRQYEAQRLRVRNPTPVVRFRPQDHGCGIEHASGGVNGIRQQLGMWGPQFNYEAIHVLCQGDQMRARCPVCGRTAKEPIVCDVIQWYMKQFPAETKGWNPLAKGLCVCSTCGGKDET